MAASRGITFTFYGNTAPLVAGLKTADAAVAGTAARASTLGSRMYAASSKLQAVGFAAQRLTMPLAIAGGASIKMAIDFEDSISKMERLAGVGHSTVVKWQKEILKLGPEVAQSPKKLADALYFLASSGVPASEAMGVLKISAKAAAAGLGDVQTVADGLSSVLNVYGYKNISAAEAANTLTEAVKLGKGEADEYARVIGRITPVANQLKIPFKDVAAAMAAVTNQGLSASEAATGIRQAMIALQKPTKAGSKLLAEAGMSMQDIRNIAEKDGLLAALRKMRDLTGGNVEQFGKLFPNVRGLNAALMLTSEEGAEQVNEIFGKMQSSTGELDGAFKKASNTTKFKMTKALSNLQAAGIELGQSFLPLVEDLSDKVSDLADWFEDLDDSTRKWIGYAIIGAMVLGPVVRMMGNLGKVLSAFVNHPGILVLIGLVALGIYLYNNWQPFHDLIEKIKDIFTGDGMKEGIKAFTDGLDSGTKATEKQYDKMGFFQRRMYDVGSGFREFGDNWSSMTSMFEEKGGGDAWSGFLQNFQDGLDRIYGWLDSWGVVELFTGVWNYLWRLVESTMQIIGGVIRFFMGLITGNWTAAWNGLKDFFAGIWNGITLMWTYIWRGIVEVLGGALGVVWNIVKVVFGWIWDRVSWVGGLIKGAFTGAWDGLVSGLSWAWNAIQWLWGVIWGFITSIPGTISSGVSGAWDGLSGSFKSAVNSIIRGWNNLSFTMPSVNTPFGTIGGWTLDTPNIPLLAEGGIVRSATLAIIGERAPEVVFPTDNPARGFALLKQAGVALPSVAGSSKGGGASVSIVNHIVAVDPRDAAKKFGTQTMWDLKSNGVYG